MYGRNDVPWRSARGTTLVPNIDPLIQRLVIRISSNFFERERRIGHFTPPPTACMHDVYT